VARQRTGARALSWGSTRAEPGLGQAGTAGVGTEPATNPIH
jgi:hypothetical protein